MAGRGSRSRRPRDGTDPLAKLQQLIAWGYPAEVLSLDDVRKLEPEINPDAIGNAPVIHYPQDGWLDPVPYSGALIAAAVERHDATVIEARVDRLVLAGERCTGIVLADGRTIEADVVVNCAGRWPNDVVQTPQHRIPLAPTLGIVAYTPPRARRSERSAHAPGEHAARWRRALPVALERARSPADLRRKRAVPSHSQACRS